MRLIHESDGGTGGTRTLATTVDTADSLFSQARGLMFRRSVPDDYALVFRFSGARARDVHMLFVAFPLDVLWIEDDAVRRIERLRPWTGFGRARADRIVELPADAAEDVKVGDEVRLVE